MGKTNKTELSHLGMAIPYNLTIYLISYADQPSALIVQRSQTFIRNERAVILCHADRDPPHDVSWIRNGGIPIYGHVVELHQDNYIVEALIIWNIQYNDSGLYKCGFNSSVGFIGVAITVNVVGLPMNSPLLELEFILPENIFILLPLIVSISYGAPLVLECNTTYDNPLLRCTWFTLHDVVVDNCTLLLSPDMVYIGECRCSVHLNGIELAEHCVFINVTDIPPLPEEPELAISRTILEGEEFVILKNFRFTPTTDHLVVQWEERVEDGIEIHNFESRFSFRFHSSRLILIINDTRLSDRGNYRVNIANSYGQAALMVNIHVIPLERTVINVHFIDISCDLIQVSLQKNNLT